ncbi:putative amino acid permease YhdG [Emticicia aquatica]|uniref:Amino acid permease YhdG n=1 Tax=Emticicia aquatica TaxID=1681835 RepID=A0ABM9ASP0_9BACT|nr:ethanolamine permease [Emticicia aquatica]CAH0996545.1 putative amino acid permease YhdG [Emticicia aquatica]
MTKPPDSNKIGLKRVLGTSQLWAIAVGMVISGEYFGWNYGWAVAGTVGFLVSVLFVTVLYITFIFSYTELTASIPDAGGPFAYAFRAMGPIGGFIAGFATLVDFVLAPPAIAMALGSYTNFLNPDIPVLTTAIVSYFVFIAINLFGIKDSANFSLLVTTLSVIEILVFMALIFPSFKLENFLANSSVNANGVFAGIPFAIWFFVAIEGVAMVAEEVKNPYKTIPKGYISAILTLVTLSIGIMVLSGGVGDWRLLSEIDHPLPETLAMALGNGNTWSKVFTSLGLFGLIASFHGNTIGYSRQIYALARSGFLPMFLSKVNRHYQTPHWALFVGGFVGFLAIFSGKTDQIIIMSVLGAIVMYVISMISLFILRKNEPNLLRPYQVPFYPIFPFVALTLSVFCMVAIIYYNLFLSLIFFVSLFICVTLFILFGMKFIKVKPKNV